MVTKPAEQERMEFSNRLNELLDEMGVPVRGRAARLREIWMEASGESISIPGARKWLDGSAIPATGKLRLLATTLNACSEWLLSGRGPKRPDAFFDANDKSPVTYRVSQIDRDLLAVIIASVDASCMKKSIRLSSREKASAIAGAYAYAVEVGATADTFEPGLVAVAIETARDQVRAQG